MYFVIRGFVSKLLSAMKFASIVPADRWLIRTLPAPQLKIEPRPLGWQAGILPLDFKIAA